AAAGERLAASIRASGGDAFAVRADITVEADIAATVRAAVDRYGRIDILHNNAADQTMETIGVDSEFDILTLDMAVYHRTLAVNLTGMITMTRHTVPVMLEQGCGS